MVLEGKKIAVLGVGEAGRAAARWLYGQGAEIFCCDCLRLEKWPPEFLSWCEGKRIPAVPEAVLSYEDIAGCDLAVVSPGIPFKAGLSRYFREKAVPVIGELALAASFWPGTMIGITGTNGKTTTTSLTSHILTCAGIPNVKAGNISPPLFDCLSQGQAVKVAVLEISSFQLEYFPNSWPHWLKRPRFSVAAILNVAPDHLDRHGSLAEYGRCKARLFNYQDKWDLAVIGPGLESDLCKVSAEKFFLHPKDKANPGMFLDKKRNILTIRLPDGRSDDYDLKKWRLKGSHNLENLAAAAASASRVGVGPDLIQNGLETFDVPGYRLQETCSRRGIVFVNDSKATNVAALIAALDALDGEVTLIAGGRGKGEDFRRLVDFLRQRNGNRPGVKLANTVLIGEEAHRIKEAIEPLVRECVVIEGSNGHKVMRQAVEHAVALSSTGSTVLLSPACASFDMFSSYKERGMVFDRIVRELK